MLKLVPLILLMVHSNTCKLTSNRLTHESIHLSPHQPLFPCRSLPGKAHSSAFALELVSSSHLIILWLFSIFSAFPLRLVPITQ